MFRFVLSLIFFAATAAIALGVIRLVDERKRPIVDDEGKPIIDRYSGRAATETYNQTVVVRWPALITAALGVLLLLWSCARVVKSTEVGVPVTLGKAGAPLDSGFHFVKPWTDVNRFTTTIQSRDIQFAVVGSDGGTMTADAAVRYQILVGEENCSVTDLYRSVRSESRLEQLVVEGEAQQAANAGFLQAPAFLGFTTERNNIVETIGVDLGARYEEKCVRLDRFVLRGLTASEKVQASIDAALVAQQQVFTSEKSAESKRIDAKGNADAAVLAAEGRKTAAEADAAANKTLADSLTPEVLQSKMIEAIGNNNNVVVLGADGATPLVQIPAAGS